MPLGPKPADMNNGTTVGNELLPVTAVFTVNGFGDITVD